MANEKDKLDFLESVKSTMDATGAFWQEGFRTSVLYAMERRYRRHVVRDWCITDVVLDGDKVLMKWQKRIEPLSEQELNEMGVLK